MKKLNIILIILVIACCKDEDPEPCMEPSNPDCANYDPCYGKELPSAAFLMEDWTFDENGQFAYVADDSIFRGTEIRFRSPLELPEFQHIWYIGAETLSGYQVLRLFRDVPRPATITIHHVIEYPVDSTCFPLDDGKDSVTQSFYLIEYWNELASFGTYRVANENSTDSFDFKIAMLLPDGSEAPFDPSINNRKRVFENFNNEGDSIDYFDYSPVNTIGYFDGNGSNTPKGSIRIDIETKKVELEFTYGTIAYKQKGRKIN